MPEQSAREQRAAQAAENHRRHWPVVRAAVGCGCTASGPRDCPRCAPPPGWQCTCHYLRTPEEYAELYEPAAGMVYRDQAGAEWRVGDIRGARVHLTPVGSTRASKWVRRAALHATPTTRTGAPRRTGYVLVLAST